MSKAPLRLTAKGRLKQYRRHRALRKPKYYKAKRPGECVGLDTIERRLQGLKRYVMTFVDLVTSFAFTVGTYRNNSYCAAELFTSAASCYPYPIQRALSDNGSEFKGAFAKLLANNDLTHLPKQA